MPRPSTTAMDPERQLMIKTKTCQRLMKECSYYEKELAENEAKLQVMIDQGKDPYDRKMFQQVVNESRIMILDSQQRMRKAVYDLQAFLDSPELATKSIVNQQSEWLLAARGIVEQHRNACTEVVHSTQAEQETKTSLGDWVDGEAF